MSRLRADAVRADPPGAGAALEVCWDGLESPAPSHNVLLRIDIGLGGAEGLDNTEASAC